MQTVLLQLAAPTLIPATAALAFPVVVNTTTLIKKFTLSNPTGTARLVTVYLVPAAGAPAAGNTITYQRSVAAGTTLELYEAENHVLPAGASVQWLCDAAAAVVGIISGAQIS